MLKAGVFLQNRYEIIYRIGSGGMADVYKAKDHKLNRFVAIKVLKQEFRDDKAFLSKFRVEAQAAAGMSHPNIVNVYDVGEDRGVSFIVMELVEGITLKAYIAKKGKLSVREAVSIALQVSAGLEAAHNNGIVHRDVKPQNILISLDGKAKVADFGIARAANSDTINSSAMGSVHYSAPEQTRGGYSDAKSDIYSMGITLFEMLTGRVPFDGDTTVEVALKHLQEDIPSPRKFSPEVPYAAEQIVLKCTQKSPDRRYSNMSELIKDLKEALVNPNGHFVVIPQVDRKAATIMLSREEMEQIKSESMPSYDNGINTGAAANLSEDGSVGGDGRDYAYGGDYYHSSGYQKLRQVRTGNDRGGVTREYPPDIQDRARHMYDDELDMYTDGDDEDFDEYTDRENSRRAGRQQRRNQIDRLMIGLFIAGAVVIAMIILVFVLRRTGIIGGTNQTVSETALISVPDLTGLTESEAREKLADAGLSYSYLGEETSSSYEAGLVISQDTAAGEEVADGTAIGYTLSSGLTSGLTVPGNLIGMTQEEAEAALTSLGLTSEINTNMYDGTIEEGLIIATNPGAGSTLSAGDTVTLYVNQQPASSLVTVINVTGSNESDAKTALELTGLYVLTTTQYSDTVEQGVVISQDIAEGTQVPAETTITLTVSAGPQSSADSSDTADASAAEDADTSSVWMCNAQLNEPEGYNGEPVRIVLEQNGEQTTIFEGVTSFPYILNVEGTAGVSTGTVFVYTLDASTWEVIQTTEYDNVAFSAVS